MKFPWGISWGFSSVALRRRTMLGVGMRFISFERGMDCRICLKRTEFEFIVKSVVVYNVAIDPLEHER